jgi:hypothetical protein
MAVKKATGKKGDEPVRVGSKTKPKKKRVLTAAESKAMARDRDGFNSKGVELRGGFFRGPKMKSGSYELGNAIVRRGFGASKPLRDFDKADKLLKQRSYKDVNEYTSEYTGSTGFGKTKPRKSSPSTKKR